MKWILTVTFAPKLGNCKDDGRDLVQASQKAAGASQWAPFSRGKGITWWGVVSEQDLQQDPGWCSPFSALRVVCLPSTRHCLLLQVLNPDETQVEVAHLIQHYLSPQLPSGETISAPRSTLSPEGFSGLATGLKLAQNTKIPLYLLWLRDWIYIPNTSPWVKKARFLFES